MKHAISLYFDSQLERALLASWRRLSAIGLKSLGDAADDTIRPHVTLAVYENAGNVEGLLDCFASFAPQCEQMPISFQSIGLFPSDTSVLFLAPTVTCELLSIHARLHEALREFVDYAEPYYMVEQWVPHSTIGGSIPMNEMSHAMSVVMEGITFPLSGQVAEIGVDEITHEPLMARPLAVHKIT